jgi:hypothetical protein
MEVISSSETSITMSQTVQRHIPEHSNLHDYNIFGLLFLLFFNFGERSQISAAPALKPLPGR